MPAPEYKDELRRLRFPVDENTRPVSVLYTFDPATNQFAPITSVGVTGVGNVLNTNLVGGILQVENLHVEMDSTGLHNIAGDQINPATEEKLDDINQGIQDLIAIIGYGVNPSGVNQYGQAITSSSTTTKITVDIPVPPGKTYLITGLVCWGNIEAEYLLYVGGNQVGGGRSAAANPTLKVKYEAPIKVLGGVSGTIISLYGIQYSNTLQTLKSNISYLEVT